MNRFVNKCEIAKGSFGKIISATDTTTNKKVVLKQLPLVGLEPKLSSRLKAELLVSKVLNHNNIVKYLHTMINVMPDE
mgnify:CR=1 FL=1